VSTLHYKFSSCIFIYSVLSRGQRVRNVEPVNNDLLRPSADPYTDRPSTARHNEDLRVALEASLADLNHENNIPEGCDLSVWERLCKHRREKLESEMLVSIF